MTMIAVEDVVTVLSRVPHFGALDVDRLAEFAASAKQVSLQAGETIIEEGEIGHDCYVIASGDMHVIGRRFDGTEMVLCRIGPGTLFGEQALLGSGVSRRSATVRAIGKTILYGFGKDALLSFFSSDQDRLDRLRDVGASQAAFRDILSRATVLEDLGADTNLAFQSFEPGQTVFRQGEEGDRVYLILKGSARAIKTDQGADTVLAEMLPGQYFGELAVLTGSPRAATVQAVTALEVASIDATWFRAAIAANPRLSSIMGSLQAMYLLPHRGIVTLQGGQLGSEPTLTAVHHLSDERRVISTRLVEMNAFKAHLVDAPDATGSARFNSDDGSVLRTVHVADGHLIEIESEGRWDQLGEAFRALIDATPVSREDLASFRAAGDFGSPPEPERDSAEIVCRCTGVTAGALTQAIADGCCTVDAVARRTTATMICGGCIPVVKEFLGEGVWQPAVCEDVLPHSAEIRAFRFRWLRDEVAPGAPGQYVVLQARIGGRWVERPYSLSDVGGDGCCEISVKLEPKGVFSPWIFDSLKPGVALRMSPPQGEFRLGPGGTDTIVFLAGGIGITPALAMMRHLKATSKPIRFHLDYSDSSMERMICRDEIDSLSQGNDWFSATLRPTRSEGRLDQKGIRAIVERFGDATYMLCGSDSFVADLQSSLLASDVSPARVISERFTPVG